MTGCRTETIKKGDELMDTTVVYADMPVTIKAYTVHCNDGTFTIVLNSRHCLEQLTKAYNHELQHIKNGDYDRLDQNVELVEIFTHNI